jgi:hypothetical protein
MKKERQEENVALISERMSIQQRHSSVGPMPSRPALQRVPTVDVHLPRDEGPRATMGKAPVPALFLLMGYFNSSDSLIRAGGGENVPMRVTAAANPHLETRSSRQVRGDSGGQCDSRNGLVT